MPAWLVTRVFFLAGCVAGWPTATGSALGAGLGTAAGPHAVSGGGPRSGPSSSYSAWATMIWPVTVSALSTVVSATPAAPLLTESIALRGPEPSSGPASSAPLLASCRSLASEISARLNGPLVLAGGTVPGTTTTAIVAWPASDGPPLGPLTCRNPASPNPVSICWVCCGVSVAKPSLFTIAAAITCAAACWPATCGSERDSGSAKPAAGRKAGRGGVSCCSVAAPVSKNCGDRDHLPGDDAPGLLQRAGNAVDSRRRPRRVRAPGRRARRSAGRAAGCLRRLGERLVRGDLALELSVVGIQALLALRLAAEALFSRWATCGCRARRPDHEAHGQGEEHRDDRDQVVAEIDQLKSPVSQCQKALSCKSAIAEDDVAGRARRKSRPRSWRPRRPRAAPARRSRSGSGRAG